MSIDKKAYDEWDMPPKWDEKPVSFREQPKVRKKPGPKPRFVPPAAPTPPPTGEKDYLIKKLVNGLRRFFVKLEIRDPKAKVRLPGNEPNGFISNIILDGNRIGYLEQSAGGDKVFVHFDKSSNIPIWHDGTEIGIIAGKIEKEIEKNYTKKLAAKWGYRQAIRISASKRV